MCSDIGPHCPPRLRRLQRGVGTKEIGQDARMRRRLVDERASGDAVAMASKGELGTNLAQLLQPAEVIEGSFEHSVRRVLGAARA